MDFVAIDVETANASLEAICQIGLASYSGGALVCEWSSLVNPESHFDGMNVMIHGIRTTDVVDAPTMPQLIGELSAQLDGRIAVCHTHFDRVAMHQACRRYELQPPDCVWLDSARVVRRTWSQFARSGYGLENVCEFIGYEFNAHDALEDAKAAAQVLLAAMAETELSVEDWLVRVGDSITAAGRLRRQGNPDGPMCGEVMVFTGALMMPRRNAADLAAVLGCDIGEGVTKKTTVLVVGDQDVAKLAGHEKSIKHRKAEALIASGQAIRVLRESDFLELVALASLLDGS